MPLTDVAIFFVMLASLTVAPGPLIVLLFAGHLRRLMGSPWHLARVNRALALAVSGSGVWLAFG